MIRKPQPEKTLSDPRKYIEQVGLNDVNALTSYLKTIESVPNSFVRVFDSETMKTAAFEEFQGKTFGLYLNDKPTFQAYLDQSFKNLINAPKGVSRSIRMVTGPSLISDISIMAPNSPVSTFFPVSVSICRMNSL